MCLLTELAEIIMGRKHGVGAGIRFKARGPGFAC